MKQMKKKDIALLMLLAGLPVLLLPFLEITGHATFGILGFSNNTSNNLTSWDDIDFTSGYVVYPNQSLTFYANYTNESGFISGFCNVSFSDGIFAMGESSNHAFNDYNYTHVFNFSGNYSYNVTCINDTVVNSYVVATDDVFITHPDANFSDSGISLDHVYTGSLVWGDLNGDNTSELLYAGANDADFITPEGYVKEYSGGSMSDLSGYVLNDTKEGSISLFDFDNDGDLDLLLSGANNSGSTSFNTMLFENDNGFVADTNLTALYFSSHAIGDIDRDGLLDIVTMGANTSGPSGNQTLVYYGRDSYASSTELLGKFRGAAALVDLDNDGILELLTIGSGSTLFSGSSFQVYNYSDGVFTVEQTLLPLMDAGMAYGDFDNDSDIDFVVGGFDNSVARTHLYRNDAGTLVNFLNLTGFREHPAYTVGDYNADGYADIVMTGDTGGSDYRLYLYLGNGTNFTLSNSSEGTSPHSGLALYDYDNDTDLDLSYSGLTDGFTVQTRILDNNVSLSIGNRPPSAPTSFNTTFNDGWLNISWNQGSDDITSSSGLYYNVRVGTTQYGNDVVSGKFGGSSNPTQGYIGNIMSRRNYSINVSTNQVYYWQVQAVDGGLEVGAWSAVQSHDPCTYTAGDWDLNVTCTVTSDLTITGDVNITGGGSLVVDDSTLTVSGDVYVMNGTLNVTNATVLTSDETVVWNASTIRLNVSNINTTLRLNSSLVYFTDSIVNGSLIYNATNISVLNTSLGSVTMEGGNISVNFWLTTNVTNTSGSGLPANTYVYQNGTLFTSGTTDSNGYRRFEIFSYVVNTSHNISFDTYNVTFEAFEKDNTTLEDVAINRNYLMNATLNLFTTPIYATYDAALTTDFASEGDLENVVDARIGRSAFGYINWTETVNVTSINFDNDTNISFNSVFINDSLEGLNHSANITLVGLGFSSTPIVLKNGVACTDCTVLSYSGGVLTFNVTGFSTYSASSTTQLFSLINDSDNNGKMVVGEEIGFHANYSDATDDSTIPSATCNLTNATGTYSMARWFGFYRTNLTFGDNGRIVNQTYNMSCSATGYEAVSMNVSAVIKRNSTMFEVNDSFSMQGVLRSSLVFGDGLLFVSGDTAANLRNLSIYNLTTTSLFGNLSGIRFGSLALVDIDNNESVEFSVLGQDNADAAVATIYEND